MAGPFQITSIHGNRYDLIFIDHFTAFTHTTFNYARVSSEILDRLERIIQSWKVVELRFLISDNADEFNPADVQQICRDDGIKRELSNPGQQFQIGKAEKCIGDVWLMTKTTTGNDFIHVTVKHVTVKVRFLQECEQDKIIMIV